jgi:hypothetical protein
MNPSMSKQGFPKIQTADSRTGGEPARAVMAAGTQMAGRNSPVQPGPALI